MTYLNKVWEAGDLVSIAVPMDKTVKWRVERMAERLNRNPSDCALEAITTWVDTMEKKTS